MINIENLETLKYHTFTKDTKFSLLFAVRVAKKDEKICKEEKPIEILKILDLAKNIEE